MWKARRVTLDLKGGNRLDGVMPVDALLHWLIRRTLGSLMAWLAALLLAGFPGLVLALGTFGIQSDLEPPSPLVYEVAFIGAIFGCSSALSALEQLRFFLARLGPVERALAEGLVLFLSAAFFGFLPVLPALLLLAGLAWNGLPMAVIGTIFHLTVLALLLLRIPWLHGSRSLALFVLAWFLPALLPPHAPFAALALALEPEAPRVLLSVGSSAPLLAIAPIIALLLMVVALDTARHATS
jgi:hypothetical protein